MLKTLLTLPNGQLQINPLKRYVKGSWVLTNPAQIPLVIAASGQSAPQIVEASQDGAMEILSLVGEHDPGVVADVQDRMEVSIEDVAYRRSLMNRSIPTNHVFGTNLQPFFLKESTMLMPQQVMQFGFFNRSTAGATAFRFALQARKIQNSGLAHPLMRKWVADNLPRKTFLNPFWLTSDVAVSLAAAGTSNVFFTNTSDKTLILFYLMGHTITAGVAGDLQERISFQIFDANAERPLQNSPVTLNTGMGTAGFPYIFPGAALVVQPNSLIRVLMTNLVTDAATEVFMTFHGVACYTGEGLWMYTERGEPDLAVSVRGRRLIN